MSLPSQLQENATPTPDEFPYQWSHQQQTENQMPLSAYVRKMIPAFLLLPDQASRLQQNRSLCFDHSWPRANLNPERHSFQNWWFSVICPCIYMCLPIPGVKDLKEACKCGFVLLNNQSEKDNWKATNTRKNLRSTIKGLISEP